MRTGEIQVDDVGLGHSDAGGSCCGSCAQGGPCEGGCEGDARRGTDPVYEEMVRRGLSGIVEDTTAALKTAVDPIAAAKAMWGAAQGKSWDAAVGVADSRAEARSWSTDLTSQMDLATLALSSAFNVAGLDKKSDPQSARVSDALSRTFYILLKRIGRAPSSGATAQQYTGNLTAAAEIPIGIVIVLAITAAVIYIAFFAFIYYVLRDCLAVTATTFTCDREMMRLHSEVDKIVANRLQDGKPYSADDLQRIADLEAAQKNVLAGCLEAVKRDPPPKMPWDLNWSTVAIVAGVLGVTALGIVYAPEIKRALAPRE